MKRFCTFLSVLVMLVSCFFIVEVSAMDAQRNIGEVLYHQNFNAVSDIVDSGITIGTTSSANSMVGCASEALEIHTYDSGRVYVILPDAEKGSEGSYTIEFTFRFTYIHTNNGYIAPILTCRGSEPTNITSLTIRADGNIDSFQAPDEALMKAISGGETIGVKIPVRSNVVHEIILTVGDIEYTLERENILMVNDGSVGFAVRNTDVEIDEVYIVYGTDYDVKNGYYAKNSYASDNSNVMIPDSSVESEEHSPATDDRSCIAAFICMDAALGAFLYCFSFRKKRL